VAAELGADIVIIDARMLANVVEGKAYSLKIGFLPWTKTVFWLRWGHLMILIPTLVYMIYSSEGFITSCEYY